MFLFFASDYLQTAVYICQKLLDSIKVLKRYKQKCVGLIFGPDSIYKYEGRLGATVSASAISG